MHPHLWEKRMFSLMEKIMKRAMTNTDRHQATLQLIPLRYGWWFHWLAWQTQVCCHWRLWLWWSGPQFPTGEDAPGRWPPQSGWNVQKTEADAGNAPVPCLDPGKMHLKRERKFMDQVKMYSDFTQYSDFFPLHCCRCNCKLIICHVYPSHFPANRKHSNTSSFRITSLVTLLWPLGT